MFRRLAELVSAAGRGRNRGGSRAARPQPPSFDRLEPRQMLAVAVAESIPRQTFAPGDVAPKVISLAHAFADATVTGTVVRLDHNAPNQPPMFVELFDQAGPGRQRTTPLTAANFLAYAAGGSYDGTLIHRSVPGFVIQGGGFSRPALPADQGGAPEAVPQRPAVVNEPGNPNLRGTIAMAKLPGNPNSATNQWFFNLADNRSLDTDNGGYTVFGRVLGTGMAAVDSLAAAPRYDAATYFGNSALNELPLWNLATDNIVRPADFLAIDTVVSLPSGPFSFSATATNTLVSAAVVDGAVLLTPRAGATGVTVVTVQATSLLDPQDTASQSFVVTSGSAPGGGPPPTDLNGDGILDVIWRDDASGASMGWVYDAAGNVATARLLGISLDYSISATGDFDGDGVTDFIWRQASSGIQLMWLMNADGSLRAATGLVGDPWRLDGTGDFNGDGKTDLIWRNPAGGQNVMWLMNGMALVGGSLVNADASWELVATSGRFDADGDGKTDLIWRHASGANVLWQMNGTVLVSAQGLGGDLDYAITGAADFDGDGQGDILWRQQSSGIIVQWLLTAGAVKSTRSFGAAGTWRVVLTADTDKDGFADIVFRDSVTGATTLWLLDAGAVGGTRQLSGPTTWSFLGSPGRRAD